jgi:hypothetical protein
MVDFSGQSAEIKGYVHWALTGGPAYYGQRTPRTCKAKKDEPGYIVRVHSIIRNVYAHQYFRLQIDSLNPSSSLRLPSTI